MCTTDLRSIIHLAFYTTQVCKLTAHMHDRCILVEYYIDIIHVSVDCQELYFPEVRSTEGNIVPRENITILAPPTRDISSVPVDICYISDRYLIYLKTFTVQ